MEVKNNEVKESAEGNERRYKKALLPSENFLRSPIWLSLYNTDYKSLTARLLKYVESGACWSESITRQSTVLMMMMITHVDSRTDALSLTIFSQFSVLTIHVTV